MVQLDGLRALAVLLVVLSHTTHGSGAVDPGAAGVRLFFVLSGFLITGILLRARTAAELAGVSPWGVLRAFYGRRFFRIFPLYYLALALAVLAELPGMRSEFLWHAAYATNVLMVVTKETPATGGHFWSLAVEEQFYLVWPFLVLFAPRRRLVFLFAAAVLAGPVTRFLGYHFLYTSMVRFLMPSCLDTLGLGALLALVREDYRKAEPPFAWACLALGVCFVALLFVVPLPRGVRLALSDLPLAFFFCYWIRAAARGIPGPGKVLAWKPVVYLGSISYGIYVWHAFVPAYAARLDWPLPEYGGRLFLVVLALSTAMAVVSWHLFEKPLNGLKRFFPYPRDRGPGDGPQRSP